MTTLKEEIESFLTENYTPTLYKGADKILKLFEKRIDSEIRNWKIDDIEVIALRRFRRELLK